MQFLTRSLYRAFVPCKPYFIEFLHYYFQRNLWTVAEKSTGLFALYREILQYEVQLKYYRQILKFTKRAIAVSVLKRLAVVFGLMTERTLPRQQVA